jgi:hypothetical protein
VDVAKKTNNKLGKEINEKDEELRSILVEEIEKSKKGKN